MVPFFAVRIVRLPKEDRLLFLSQSSVLILNGLLHILYAIYNAILHLMFPTCNHWLWLFKVASQLIILFSSWLCEIEGKSTMNVVKRWRNCLITEVRIWQHTPFFYISSGQSFLRPPELSCTREHKGASARALVSIWMLNGGEKVSIEHSWPRQSLLAKAAVPELWLSLGPGADFCLI